MTDASKRTHDWLARIADEEGSSLISAMLALSLCAS